MPTAIVLDGRGREIHRPTGAFAIEAAMEEVLKRLLQGSGTCTGDGLSGGSLRSVRQS